MTAHRFCCPYFHIPQGRGSVRGKTLRVSPLAFSHPPAGDHFCTAKVPHQKRRGTRTCVSSFLVRAMGLEPTRPYGHKHLKLACLPIPARSRTRYLTIIAKPGSLSSTGGKFACCREERPPFGGLFPVFLCAYSFPGKLGMVAKPRCRSSSVGMTSLISPSLYLP